MGLIRKFLCLKGNDNNTKTRQNTKTALGEIISPLVIQYGVISKIYKALVILYKKKKIFKAIKKWGEEIKRNFLKEEMQIAKRHMKKML